ncbi:hypothetical protein ACQVQ5_07835 [Bacillus mycoides]
MAIVGARFNTPNSKLVRGCLVSSCTGFRPVAWRYEGNFSFGIGLACSLASMLIQFDSTATTKQEKLLIADFFHAK